MHSADGSYLPACSNHDSLCLIRPTKDRWETLLRALFADIPDKLLNFLY